MSFEAFLFKDIPKYPQAGRDVAQRPQGRVGAEPSSGRRWVRGTRVGEEDRFEGYMEPIWRSALFAKCPSPSSFYQKSWASKYKVNTAKRPTDDIKVPSRVMNVRSNSKVIAMFSNVSVFWASLPKAFSTNTCRQWYVLYFLRTRMKRIITIFEKLLWFSVVGGARLPLLRWFL